MLSPCSNFISSHAPSGFNSLITPNALIPSFVTSKSSELISQLALVNVPRFNALPSITMLTLEPDPLTCKIGRRLYPVTVTSVDPGDVNVLAPSPLCSQVNDEYQLISSLHQFTSSFLTT